MSRTFFTKNSLVRRCLHAPGNESLAKNSKLRTKNSQLTDRSVEYVSSLKLLQMVSDVNYKLHLMSQCEHPAVAKQEDV